MLATEVSWLTLRMTSVTPQRTNEDVRRRKNTRAGQVFRYVRKVESIE